MGSTVWVVTDSSVDGMKAMGGEGIGGIGARNLPGLADADVQDTSDLCDEAEHGLKVGRAEGAGAIDDKHDVAWTAGAF